MYLSHSESLENEKGNILQTSNKEQAPFTLS